MAVADKLPFPVVLGHDLPVLWDLLQAIPKCNLVTTRSKAAKLKENQPLLSVLPFSDMDVETSDYGKPRKTCRQKRWEKMNNASKMLAETVPDCSPKFQVPMNIAQLQQEDASLAPLMDRAMLESEGKEVDSDETKERYILQQGVLYLCLRSVTQLVVPQCVCEVILILGHSIPWAFGHLGKGKTLARIRRYFHWPGGK